ncbi:hypothetical protein KW789_02420 [Candidatus Saccharibacteria bacterium]|nr:hypothetical protein [Candidatus Saccharibacteria bacterium]
MRASLLVLRTDVLQVKQVECGDRHRIVVCTDSTVAWPDEASVIGLRADLQARVPGLTPDSISMPMAACRGFNILLVIDLGSNVSENKAGWVRFETERVVCDSGRVLGIAAGSSSITNDKRKEPLVKRPPVRRALAAA